MLLPLSNIQCPKKNERLIGMQLWHFLEINHIRRPWPLILNRIEHSILFAELNTQHWTPNIVHWTEHSTLNTQYCSLNWTPNIEHPIVFIEHPILFIELNTQHWTPNIKHSTLNTQHCSLNTQRSPFQWRRIASVKHARIVAHCNAVVCWGV